MNKQFLKKRAKILLGLYKTKIANYHKPYSPDTWYDEKFYIAGISDRQTISPYKDILTGAYHYASVELIILRHLCKHGLDLDGKNLCDLGSGAGHWIDFYLSLGISSCIGIDISIKAADFLSKKYSAQNKVNIYQGNMREILQNKNDKYDLVNAIGVMFHLVDDVDWQETIEQIAHHLKPGGLFVVGGHFGWLDNLNVQFDSQNNVNKRLRSQFHWKRILNRLGFGAVTLYRNNNYLFIPGGLPENNILISMKK